jgi:hypothetical protein
MAAAKPTKVDNLKGLHKEFKAGIAALAKAKLITAAEKTKRIAEFDDKFKALIKEEQAKLKAKAKKKK